MAKKATINRILPSDAGTRASELGFPMAVLTPTIQTWIAGMNSGTDLHAENYAGTIAYHSALYVLRLEGLRFDLEKASRSNVQLCVCAKTRVAVVITQGDCRTGDMENLHLKPSTKYPRGPKSCEVLEAQLSLFPKLNEEKSSEHEVWVLLLHMLGNGDTRAELSRPSVISIPPGSDTGTILDWHERIFLGTFPATPLVSAIPGDLTPTEMVDVPLKKRG